MASREGPLRGAPTRGSRWRLVVGGGTLLAPIGTVAVVRKVESDAIGYRYETGAHGVMPLGEWTQHFVREEVQP